jgi:hypothetical protein
MNSARRSLLALSFAGVLCVAGIAATAPSARAAAPAGTATCPQSTLSQPFAQWGDLASYGLVPGGDFESSSWTLSGGAARRAGNVPFASAGGPGAVSVSLPPGASATSPPICLDATEPTLRFFTGGTGAVLVQMIDRGVAIPVGLALADGQWRPSPVVPTDAAMLARNSPGTVQASIRLTGVSGRPNVDNVYIDPWNRG